MGKGKSKKVSFCHDQEKETSKRLPSKVRKMCGRNYSHNRPQQEPGGNKIRWSKRAEKTPVTRQKGTAGKHKIKRRLRDSPERTLYVQAGSQNKRGSRERLEVPFGYFLKSIECSGRGRSEEKWRETVGAPGATSLDLGKSEHGKELDDLGEKKIQKKKG